MRIVSIESNEEAGEVADWHNQLKKLIEGQNLQSAKDTNLFKLLKNFLSIYHQLLPCLLQLPLLLLLVDGDAAVEVDQEVNPFKKFVTDPSLLMV